MCYNIQPILRFNVSILKIVNTLCFTCNIFVYEMWISEISLFLYKNSEFTPEVPNINFWAEEIEKKSTENETDA